MPRTFPLVVLAALAVGCASSDGGRGADGGAGSAAAAPGADVSVADIAPAAGAALLADHAAWIARREAGLRSETGYLALCGLHWVEPGSQSVGSASDSDRVFPAWTPARLGELTRSDDALLFVPASGVELFADEAPVDGPVALLTDADDGGPTRLRVGTLTFWGIRRGERVGLRLRDARSPVLASYVGTPRYDFDPEWRVTARFVPYATPREVRVANILGDLAPDTVPGELVFEHDGRTLRLLPTGDVEHGLGLMFGDATNGRATYGGGRFLALDVPDADGRVVLDFNRAYNPPCAYSPYTTCPLPLDENVLDVEVTAGERAYDDDGGHVAPRDG
ncbi:MAG: DUF1684 domain-containing protein [Planctomycetes bacterium]|nr:DUF1684 domain-containing protein [Planctomycetota bacterium]